MAGVRWFSMVMAAWGLHVMYDKTGDDIELVVNWYEILFVILIYHYRYYQRLN